MKKAGILLALCLLMAGCGVSDNVGETPVEKEQAEIVTLEFYTWTDEKYYMTDAIRAFMEIHPEIQVNIHLIPSSEYAQTISILHNSDDRKIDVFTETKPSAAAADVKKNYVLDITEMAEKCGATDEYGEMLESLKIDRKIYMMPYRKSTWAVYYNKTIFDQKGIPYPEGDWTWEDYTETARELTGSMEDQYIYGSMSYETSSMWWRTPVRTEGIENTMTQAALKEFKKAAEWNYQMAYEWEIQPAFTELTDVSSYDYVSTFLEGNIAMFYCGDWAMEMIDQQTGEKEPEFEYDIAPLPGPSEGERYMPVTTAVVQVSSRSENPEEAFLLTEFLAGKEGAEILAENGIIPAVDTDEIRRILQERQGAPKHISYFLEYDRAVYTLPNEKMEEALQVVNRYVGQYLMKESGLEETFQMIESILEERELFEEDE